MYEKMKAFFLGQYSQKYQVPHYTDLLQLRVQKHDESIRMLSEDIARLVTLGYGPRGEQKEMNAMSSFKHAITDVKIREKLTDREPETLAEAVNIAGK